MFADSEKQDVQGSTSGKYMDQQLKHLSSQGIIYFHVSKYYENKILQMAF